MPASTLSPAPAPNSPTSTSTTNPSTATNSIGSAERTPPSYRVEKMLPKDKVDSEHGNYKVYETLKYNDSLTLRGIPERAFAYRLGNRSALDWIVDQYRVKTDKRSGITHDPNGYSDDPQYILKLIESVITVSLRTVDIVEHTRQTPLPPRLYRLLATLNSRKKPLPLYGGGVWGGG